MQALRVDAQDLCAAQAHLRDRLLGNRGMTAEERGVAAEMLLYLDDLSACWSVCASWLLTRTGADRIDAGFATSTDPIYVPAMERRHVDEELPSVLDLVFDAHQEAIRAVWRARGAVVYHDAEDDPRIHGEVREVLLAAGTRSKIAVALRDRGREIGLLCLDSRRPFAWSAAECERTDRITRDVLGPILGAALELAEAKADAPTAVHHSACLPGLTPAETRVAALVLAGYSYKEIARKLDRSCSTIDHQLRSMRQKLGVNSTAKLMRELAHITGARQPA